MKNKTWEIYGAKVQIVSITSSTVTYKTMHNGLTHRIGRKNWNANAKKA